MGNTCQGPEKTKDGIWRTRSIGTAEVRGMRQAANSVDGYASATFLDPNGSDMVAAGLREAANLLRKEADREERNVEHEAQSQFEALALREKKQKADDEHS